MTPMVAAGETIEVNFALVGVLPLCDGRHSLRGVRGIEIG